MSVTSGFFNSLNSDRKYSAEDFSNIYSGVINDGVFASVGTCFVVHATSTASQKVTVGIGRAWFNGTWTLNDSVLTVTLPNADMLQPRIDAVVLQIDARNDVRKNSIAIVQGTAADSPVNPTLEKDFTTNRYAQYALCYIKRPANTNAITETNITNAVGTDETPFVTGILQTLSISELLTKWQAEWEEYVGKTENEIAAWYDEKQAEFTEWTKGQQKNYTTWTTNKQSAMTEWMDAQQTEFTTWFNNLKTQLSDNVAAQLQIEITNEEIKRLVTNGLDDGDKNISDDGTTITTTDSSGRMLTKVFTDNFQTSTSTLKSSTGAVLATLVKKFSSDGKDISSTLTIS